MNSCHKQILSKNTSSEQGNKCCLLNQKPPTPPLSTPHDPWMPGLGLGRARLCAPVAPLRPPPSKYPGGEAGSSATLLLRFQGGSEQTPSDVLQLKTSPVHGSAHHGPAPRVPSASLCRGPLVYARPSLAFGGASPLPPPIPPPLPTVQPAWGTCALWRGRGAHFGCHSLLLEASPCITRPWDCRAK